MSRPGIDDPVPDEAAGSLVGELTAQHAALAVHHLQVAAYRFVVQADTEIPLPAYSGSTLRGGLGHALRSKVCLTGLPDCALCPLRTRCLYPYVFETDLALQSTTPPGRGDVPRPYVLVPPDLTRTILKPEEQFSFGLTLMGSVIQDLPYFLHAFQRFGEHGVGRSRGRFRVVRVERLHAGRAPAVISDGVHLTMPPEADRATTGGEIAKSWTLPGVRRVGIRFLTPARFKSSGRFVSSGPTFSVLIGRLLDRLEGISLYHHGAPLAIDFRAWRRCAEEIQLVESDVRWHDWTRYSNRQLTEMQLGGLVGTVTYTGDLGPFLPFLGIGEWLHVGKGATFGLGRYHVELPNQVDGDT
jgi:hypothetical protein